MSVLQSEIPDPMRNGLSAESLATVRLPHLTGEFSFSFFFFFFFTQKAKPVQFLSNGNSLILKSSPITC